MGVGVTLEPTEDLVLQRRLRADLCHQLQPWRPRRQVGMHCLGTPCVHAAITFPPVRGCRYSHLANRSVAKDSAGYQADGETSEAKASSGEHDDVDITGNMWTSARLQAYLL